MTILAHDMTILDFCFWHQLGFSAWGNRNASGASLVL
jgi:hypothetical protein